MIGAIPKAPNYGVLKMKKKESTVDILRSISSRLFRRRNRISFMIFSFILLIIHLTRNPHTLFSTGNNGILQFSAITDHFDLSTITTTPNNNAHDSMRRRRSDKLSIAIVNTPRYHFEVVLPLIHAFSHQDIVDKIELYATDYGANRFGVGPMLHRQLPRRSSSIWDFIKGENSIGPQNLTVRGLEELKDSEVVDLMILTSCSRDITYDQNSFEFWKPDDINAPREIICIIHEADEWRDNQTAWRHKLQPWIDAGKVTGMLLSPHVMEYLVENLQSNWNMSAILLQEQQRMINISGLRLFDGMIPVFEDGEIMHMQEKWQGYKWMGYNTPFAAIPGKYEPGRRNYQPIFSEMTKYTTLLNRSRTTLRLMGFGATPEITQPTIKKYVSFHNDLAFTDYFSLLSDAMAVIPAFAHDRYLIDRASSTIASAVIAGVPLIASRELLNKYWYLEDEAVWIRREWESEVDAWARIIKYGEDAWETKRRVVQDLRSRLIGNNVQFVGKVLRDVKWRIDAREAREDF